MNTDIKYFKAVEASHVKNILADYIKGFADFPIFSD